MDHNRALEIQAIERYFLGDLEPEDREQFEEHYFTCAECGQGVRDAARFRANGRELLRNPAQFEPPERERRSGWWSWQSLVPLSAVFALLGVVGYQNLVVIPGMRVGRIGDPLPLDGLTRGSQNHLEEGAPVFLKMVPRTPAAGKAIAAELMMKSRVVSRSDEKEPTAGSPITVSFPGKFQPGRYTVFVREMPSKRLLFEDNFEIVAKENKRNE